MPDSPLVGAVAAIVRAVAKIPSEVPIGPESRLVDDLGIDSLDLVGIFLKVQDELDVAIDDDDVPNLRRVSDLVAYVTTRRPSAAA